MEVTEIFSELSDGIKLLKLLEIISDSKIASPSRSSSRFHKIDNVSRALQFLSAKVLQLKSNKNGMFLNA